MCREQGEHCVRLNGATCFARGDADNLRAPSGVCIRTRISGNISSESPLGNGARTETVCAKAIAKRGYLEGPRERPSNIGRCEEGSNARFLRAYLASGGSSFFPTSRVWV